MRISRFKLFLSTRIAVVLLAASTALSVAFAANTEKIVYSFSNIGDGMSPEGNLTPAGSQGFFGTTRSGGKGTLCGKDGCGTVFELKRSGSVWTKTTLYSFKGGTDGWEPNGGLIHDKAGNLYGTTYFGGLYGFGTAFELTHPSGVWTETILYNFGSYVTDGVWPPAGMIFDKAGNLYGTTSNGGGGTNDGGIVFELTRSGSGWTENVLHVFGNGNDGSVFQGGLVMDSAGNLFGATYVGGTGSSCFENCGTVFELTPSQGAWVESVLYNFAGGADGAYPDSTLTFDIAGNLYGLTQSGGTGTGCPAAGLCGTAFELAHGADGSWTESVIYSFGAYSHDAYNPVTGLTVDTSGNLYGVTYEGGSGFCIGGCGAVFKLVPSAGAWTETLLHSFLESGDGKFPAGGVALDNAGNLYGTTSGGGRSNLGIVYEITP